MGQISQTKFTLYWTEAMPVVSAYINSMVPDLHEAQDILQEVSVVLFRKLDTYDDERPFLNWAMGVARREVLSLRRHHARHPMLYSERISDLVAETCERMAPELELRKKALKHCLGLLKLKGRSREAFSLHYHSSMKPRDVAEHLNMTAGAVRVMLCRIRETLRKCVQKQLIVLQGSQA